MCDNIAAFSEREIKITENVTANDDGINPKEMLDILSSQKQAFIFLCYKQGDRNIKVLHSLVLLVVTFGEKKDNQHHNNYIFFKRDQTKRSNPGYLLFIK